MCIILYDLSAQTALGVNCLAFVEGNESEQATPKKGAQSSA